METNVWEGEFKYSMVSWSMAEINHWGKESDVHNVPISGVGIDLQIKWFSSSKTYG